jgi:hypothetical protein
MGALGFQCRFLSVKSFQSGNFASAAPSIKPTLKDLGRGRLSANRANGIFLRTKENGLHLILKALLFGIRLTATIAAQQKLHFWRAREPNLRSLTFDWHGNQIESCLLGLYVDGVKSR